MDIKSFETLVKTENTAKRYLKMDWQAQPLLQGLVVVDKAL